MMIQRYLLVRYGCLGIATVAACLVVPHTPLFPRSFSEPSQIKTILESSKSRDFSKDICKYENTTGILSYSLKVFLNGTILKRVFMIPTTIILQWTRYHITTYIACLDHGSNQFAAQVFNTMRLISNFAFNFLLHVYLTITKPSAQTLLVSCILLYLAGSFVFDVVHYLLHQCSKSRHRLLRSLGYLHQVHHLYYNRNLKFNKKYLWLNLFLELPLELSCQLLGTWLGWLVADCLGFTGSRLMSRELLLLVLWFDVLRIIVVAFLDGQDSNHQPFSSAPKDINWLTVGPQYHALHHVDPTAYISSTIRLFDWILGTGNSLRRRRIAITGASGAFGTAIKHQLQQEGVQTVQELKFGIDWTYDNYDSTIPILADTDILILAHGSKLDHAMEANCQSAVRLIELFQEHHKPRPIQKMLLPEVWYVGSEIELHSSWGLPNLEPYSRSKRSFVPHARALYDDPSILYRHIVPSAFRSPMGSAIVSAEWAAWVAMWWIRRGARYVPVTYTGLAYLNYFKFMYWIKKA